MPAGNAKSLTVYKPSMLELRCDAAARCGGCPLIGLPRLVQRKLKQERLEASLRTLGLGPVPIEWLAVAAPRGYRNRVRLRLDEGVPRFFNPDKRPDCAVLEPPLHEALSRFRDWAVAHRRLLACFVHAEIRTPDLDGVAGLVLAPPPGTDQAACSSLSASVQDAPLHGFVRWVRGCGHAPLQRYPITEQVYTFIPVGSFRQVNTTLNAALVAHLGTWFEAGRVQQFADVYAGAGNFGMPLLARGFRGDGVEEDATAIAGLQRAAAEQGLEADGYRASDAERWLSAWEPGRFDVVVVDPPRAGLKETAAQVARLRAPQVVLLSCAWAGFERDVVRLLQSGYRLTEVCLADMFPHTEHVELMTRFVQAR